MSSRRRLCGVAWLIGPELTPPMSFLLPCSVLSNTSIGLCPGSLLFLLLHYLCLPYYRTPILVSPDTTVLGHSSQTAICISPRCIAISPKKLTRSSPSHVRNARPPPPCYISSAPRDDSISTFDGARQTTRQLDL